MLNVAIIMGRLTRDPELRRTNSGKPVASFTVAVDRDYAAEGQEKETDFIDCVAWNGTAEFVSKYFSKGSMIVVNGRLQLRNWTDKEGNKRRSAEILAGNVYFGESKKQDNGPRTSQNSYQGGYPPQQGYAPQLQNGPGGIGYGVPQGYSNQVQPQQSYPQPQYSQQGFGGYQQNPYPNQGFQAPHPQQGSFAPIEDDDANLPF